MTITLVKISQASPRYNMILIGRFHLNPLKTAKGVAETRITVEKLPKDHNSSKHQSSITSVKYDHLQVMETINGKFHQNSLRNVGGVAETRTYFDKMAKTDRRPLL